MTDTNGAKGRLAARRKEKGLTQAELAQRIGQQLGIPWTDFYEEGEA